MADVDALGDEVVIADLCGVACVGAAGNDGVLPDAVVVAYDELGGFSGIVVVLRYGAQHAVLVYLVVLAEPRPVEDADVGHNLAVISDYYVFLHVGKGMDGDVFPDFGFGIYTC